ncbi:MAG: hypothetical protein R2883_07920 [Caldisericia bacterium]
MDLTVHEELASNLNGVNIMFVSGSPEAFVAPSGNLWVIGAGADGSTLGLCKVRFDTKNRTIDNIDATNEYAFNAPASVSAVTARALGIS